VKSVYWLGIIKRLNLLVAIYKPKGGAIWGKVWSLDRPPGLKLFMYSAIGSVLSVMA